MSQIALGIERLIRFPKGWHIRIGDTEHEKFRIEVSCAVRCPVCGKSYHLVRRVRVPAGPDTRINQHLWQLYRELHWMQRIGVCQACAEQMEPEAKRLLHDLLIKIQQIDADTLNPSAALLRILQLLANNTMNQLIVAKIRRNNGTKKHW